MSKEIGTLASQLYTIPGEVAKTHGVGEKADAMVLKKLGLKPLRGEFFKCQMLKKTILLSSNLGDVLLRTNGQKKNDQKLSK